VSFESREVVVAGLRVPILVGGGGTPVVVLHHDIGNPGWIPFYETLSARHRVVVPTHPGFDGADRPEWMRSVRELAALYRWILHELELSSPYLVGLGFGGFLAAELATLAHGTLPGLALINPMGLQPREGEILDQFLINSEEYVSAGFCALDLYRRQFGDPPDVDQLVTWEINREMTTRIAWKPYLFDPALDPMLPGVDAPTLVVCGEKDRIVPPVCGRQYAERIPGARLVEIADCGHFADLERPDELASLILGHFAG
jgi:pimeloyl-ACP methyl ester carboxylesterase